MKVFYSLPTVLAVGLILSCGSKNQTTQDHRGHNHNHYQNHASVDAPDVGLDLDQGVKVQWAFDLTRDQEISEILWAGVTSGDQSILKGQSIEIFSHVDPVPNRPMTVSLASQGLEIATRDVASEGKQVVEEIVDIVSPLIDSFSLFHHLENYVVIGHVYNYHKQANKKTFMVIAPEHVSIVNDQVVFETKFYGSYQVVKLVGFLPSYYERFTPILLTPNFDESLSIEKDALKYHSHGIFGGHRIRISH